MKTIYSRITSLDNPPNKILEHWDRCGCDGCLYVFGVREPTPYPQTKCLGFCDRTDARIGFPDGTHAHERASL